MRHLLREIEGKFEEDLGTSPPEAGDYLEELNEVAKSDYNKYTFL